MAKSNTRARLLSLILAAALIICAVTPALADETHWAQGIVDELNTVYGEALFTADDGNVAKEDAIALFQKLKSDTDTGMFTDPTDQSEFVRRDKMCHAIYELFLGLMAYPDPEVDELKSFEDVPPGDIQVRTLATLGLVNGVGYGYFLPQAYITNAEMAVLIYRAYNKMGGVRVAKDLIEGTGNFNDFPGFIDVPPEHWAYEGIMYLQSLGIVNGRGDGTYGPEENLTRAELSAVVLRVKNVLNGGSEGDAYTPSSDYISPSDVSAEDWFYETAAHALENGYLVTDAYGNFNPFDIVTREEVGYASVRLYMEASQTLIANTSVLDRFSDGGDVSARYINEMSYLVSIGMFMGDGLGHLMPRDTMSRATLGLFISRVMRGLDTSKMHDYEMEVKEALGLLDRPTGETDEIEEAEEV
ncbi:MAG: S-layer homology domain-containing protein [Oscillospiraceae bacterium]|jgi:hypothetical protein|nr:S-layer homology domain-containing protein [Oscillospiraceae bacterium]